MSRHFVTVMKSTDEYVSGQRSNRRIVLLIVVRVLVLINALRFGLSAIINEVFIIFIHIFSKLVLVHPLKNCIFQEWMRDLMCDPTYFAGEPRLMAFMLFSVHTTTFLVGSVLMTHELSHHVAMWDLFFSLKYKGVRYSLIGSNSKMFERKVALADRYLLNVFMDLTINVTMISTMVIQIVMYFDESTNYNLFVMLAFLTTQPIVVYHTVGIFWVNIMFWYTTSLYLGFKFNEIYNRMYLSVKSIQNRMSYLILRNALTEHVHFENLTKRLNHTFRVIVFISYYFFTPGGLAAAYGAHHMDTLIYMRYVLAFNLMSMYLIAIMMCRLTTNIAKSAESPRQIIYSYLIRTQLKFTSKQRLRLMSFVEHLSEREIGFYCYDLFPVNNNELYEYLYNTGLNYFLIMSLF